MKYLFLIIIIVAAFGAYSLVIGPQFQNISTLRTDIAGYTDQLQTAEKLKSSREQLIATYNSVQKSDLDSIKTLLPDSVDNIRLIIQMNALAIKNNLSTVRSVDYDVDNTAGDPASTAAQTPYGTFKISFETTGSYSNFLGFISDMEQNLRLIDITSVTFTPVAQSTVADNQDYKVTLNTYWLRQ